MLSPAHEDLQQKYSSTIPLHFKRVAASFFSSVCENWEIDQYLIKL